jgi:hypothetical protein
MTDRFFTLATAAAAIVQAGVTIFFFGTLIMIALSSFSVIPAPY